MSDSAGASGSQTGEGRAVSRPRVRVLLVLIGVVVLALIATAGVGWWRHGRFVQSTNDAYLQADAVTVAPKVQGYVDQVFVVDNQAVAAGQPLLKINPNSYDASVAQQSATVDARKADILAAESQVAQQRAAVEQSQAQLAGARANAAYTAGEAARYAHLSAAGVETHERSAQARNQHDMAEATLRGDIAASRQAELQLATLGAQIGQARAQQAAAQAQARAAQLSLGDTLIRAGISGRVGDKSVRVGQFVQPGARLMSLVPVEQVYLVANFKETQIGRMRIGQHARVKIDAFGDREIDAVVESFAPGTGAQFALLPAQNATGNFTKIVQRVSVRLRLQAPAALRPQLLPGLSASVRIDTARAPEGQS